MLRTPPSLKEEHEEIMTSLNQFSKLPDITGRSVRELLDVLEPHFRKEEELAMPVLGTLPELVSGEKISDLTDIVESQRPLLKEYSSMFKEHAEIRKFIDRAEKAARQEKNDEVINLLQALAHHARVEEEVLYPAALLAGTVAKNLLYEKRST